MRSILRYDYILNQMETKAQKGLCIQYNCYNLQLVKCFRDDLYIYRKGLGLYLPFYMYNFPVKITDQSN